MSKLDILLTASNLLQLANLLESATPPLVECEKCNGTCSMKHDDDEDEDEDDEDDEEDEGMEESSEKKALDTVTAKGGVKVRHPRLGNGVASIEDGDVMIMWDSGDQSWPQKGSSVWRDTVLRESDQSAVKNPVQAKILAYLQNGPASLTDMAAHPSFRGIHFAKIMVAAELLNRAGAISSNDDLLQIQSQTEASIYHASEAEQLTYVMKQIAAAGEQGVRIDELPMAGVRNALQSGWAEAERGSIYITRKGRANVSESYGPGVPDKSTPIGPDRVRVKHPVFGKGIASEEDGKVKIDWANGDVLIAKKGSAALRGLVMEAALEEATINNAEAALVAMGALNDLRTQSSVKVPRAAAQVFANFLELKLGSPVKASSLIRAWKDMGEDAVAESQAALAAAMSGTIVEGVSQLTRAQAARVAMYALLATLADGHKVPDFMARTFAERVAEYFGGPVTKPRLIAWYEASKKLPIGSVDPMSSPAETQDAPDPVADRERGYGSQKSAPWESSDTPPAGLTEGIFDDSFFALSNDVEFVIRALSGQVEVGMGGEWWGGHIKLGKNVLRHTKEAVDPGYAPVNVNVRKSGTNPSRFEFSVSGGFGREAEFTMTMK